MSKLIPITIAIFVYFFGFIPLVVIIGLPEWITLLIVTSVPFGFMLYRHIRSGMEVYDKYRYSMPYQVLKLVQQAHANQEFNTDPHIRVSPEMREKLIYPLNPTLAVINGATEYPVTEHDFIYDIAESKYVNGDLHVTISVNIDYCDTAKHINVHYHDVLLYIVCSPVRDSGLQITSVEHN